MLELGELIGSAGNLNADEKKLLISSITADSRKASPGCIFAALAGSKVDGGKFISQAVGAGASVVIVGEDTITEEDRVPIVRVLDPRLMLAQIAAKLHPRQPATMMAVTGTAGKTSVAEFLRQIWKGCGLQAAFIGTTGVVAPGHDEYGNLTTPDPVTLHQLLSQLANEGVTHGAMEASSHGLDQKRQYGVTLSAAGFTNLGRDHLDYHHDIETYFQAKMRLFSELLPKGSPAVIFADDPYSERVIEVAKNAGHNVLSVGRKGTFLTLKRVEHGQHNQVAEVVYEDRIYRIDFPLAGDFQIANGLVAAGLALSGGEKIECVVNGLENLKGASGRLELIGRKENGAPVYVDYAHKPDALENVLTSLRPFASNNLVLVFGCGGDRDPGKRPIMGEIGERLADKIIVTDDNPRTEDAAEVRKAILTATPSAIEIGDRGQAIRTAIEDLDTGDCLVIAGKGHESGQIVGETVLEFSDHVEARKVLEALST